MNDVTEKVLRLLSRTVTILFFCLFMHFLTTFPQGIDILLLISFVTLSTAAKEKKRKQRDRIVPKF